MRQLATAMGLAITWASVATPATRTLVLRQGHNGYTGVRDTWVSQLDWDTPPQHTVNYGANPLLVLSRDEGDNPLLRFDLSAIPPNSSVSSATLRLHNSTFSAGLGRVVRAHRVLRDWDEGNQVASPVDATGKHGATGDNAFDFFSGEGTDVPWSGRGMLAGADFEASPTATASISARGAVDWEVTALVRQWVRGEVPNRGLVLRDATGYADLNPDSRELDSSQSADAELRPALIVVYDPDTPNADAGPDRIDRTWNGGPVTLDGSGSRDRPGGNDATLRFAWRIVTAAYGSHSGGAVVGTSKIVSFTPDAAGEWEVELAVTNDVGSSATDRVRLRLQRIRAEHPRIYLDPERLAALRQRAVAANPRWAAVLDEADAGDGEMHAKALVGVITGQASYCLQAVATALAVATNPDDWSEKAGDVALVYDWCHDRLSASDRQALLAYFTAWATVTPHSEDVPGWGNYWPRWGYSHALAGLATFGDTPVAETFLDEYRDDRFGTYDQAALERIADGGAWPEGDIYDPIANLSRVRAVEAWRTATGENLFLASRWFRERAAFLLLRNRPGVGDQWGRCYRPYTALGDAERNRGSMVNYGRIMALILVGAFGDDPSAAQLQAYLAAPPCDSSMPFEAHDEFMFFEPERPTLPPTMLAHLAEGTGTVLARSGWPAGPADDDGTVTHLTFQCGDRFTYHQHYDQNAFTLWKGGDLLVDSGVYSGDGLSWHDVNYYVRTVAHNTLTVFNPDESFQGARPDAESNDGGQRPPYPSSRSPESVAYWDEHRAHYETGDIERFEDAPGFVYALGNATAAYNTAAYNQAVDTGLAGNVAKVSRFVRELVYLRPTSGGSTDALVLLDRVAVAEARFSGASTKLLFHTLGEPTVDGTATLVSPGETLHAAATLAAASSGTARVFISFLAPPARQVRKVGGRGVKAFWVNGTSYDWHWEASEPQPRPVNDFEDVPYGEWRLELEPADTALEHVFLTVVHPSATPVAAPPPTRLVTATGLIGAEIGAPELPRVTLFSAAADGTAPGGTLTYAVTAARAAHALFDLAPGTRYRLATAPTGGGLTVTLTPDAAGNHVVDAQGVLTFATGGETPRVRRRLGR